MIDNIELRPVYHDSNTYFHVYYDVFISFRGKDVRKNFLPKLIQALRRKGIDVFTDEQIQKGKEIGPQLYQAIEASLLSLIIISPNFFNSRWCLDEAVKIDQCKDKDGQIVYPVFFGIMPSDLRNQTGKEIEEAFSAYEKEYGVISDRVTGWRNVFKRIADISGFCLSGFENEDELIKKIVENVLSKLDDILKKKRQSKRIGLGNQISHVEALLKVGSKDVRAISIWGMACSGKTTIAEGVYNKIHSQFDACYFMLHIREEWTRHGRKNLKKEFYSNLISLPNLHIVDTQSGLPDDAERMLRGMKVLVVLDDVNDLQQLNYLIGSTLDWFGKGSRIIITTRDKQVLPKWVYDYDVYEVKPLDFDDSYRLFNLHAFNQNHPQVNNKKLCKKMVNDFAQGNPLVLKELGCFLGGKATNTWKSQLKKLAREPSLLKNVHDAIKVSYNDLSCVEKKVFLDIAFVSDGLHLKVDNIRLLMNVDNIQLLLKDGGGYNLVDVLHSLKNKGLLTISQHNVVSMYIIIQAMASKINLEESRGKQLLPPNVKGSEPPSIKLPANERHLNFKPLPSLLKSLDASGCESLKTVVFPSADLQMLKENKTKVSFWNCLKLDEPSLKDIGLNARINMMNFASQHVSTSGNHYDSQATYVYPGSIVPEWLEYKTTSDYMTIDLSQYYFDHLGFIFCFIVPEVESQGSILRFNIAIGCEGEDDYIQVDLDRPSHGIQSDHVYLMYNQVLSCYIKSRLKNQPKLEIRVTAESTLTSKYVPLMLLKGFGISPINTSKYKHFCEQMELADSPSHLTTPLKHSKVTTAIIRVPNHLNSRRTTANQSTCLTKNKSTHHVPLFSQCHLITKF